MALEKAAIKTQLKALVPGKHYNILASSTAFFSSPITYHVYLSLLLLLLSQLIAAAAAPWRFTPAGTKEHKACESGDPAYHLGNVGSDDHRVHTGFGLTGKVHPKSIKAHEAKDKFTDHTKDKLTEHVLRGHDIKKPKRGRKDVVRKVAV
jgi:hypothetical protein